MNNAVSFDAVEQPEHSFFLDGLLLFMGALFGSVLMGGTFFHDYIAQGQTANLIGLIGFVGTAIYFMVVAFSRPNVINRRRYIVIISTCLLIILFVSQRSVAARQGSPHAVEDVSDSMVQIESAATFLLHGQNPYTADFTNSANGWRFDPKKDGHFDPARKYYIYPPMSTLVVVPVVYISELLHVSPDGRIVTLAALIIFWLVLIRQQKSLVDKARITLLTIGNPGLYLLAIAGFNDMIVAMAVLLSAVYGKRNQWTRSAIWLAIAVGTKQTSWLLALLWLPWMWSVRHLLLSQKIRAITVFTAASLLIFGPFLLWNAGSFIQDTVWYMALALPANHAITGPTLVPLLGSLKNIPGLVSGIQVLLGVLGLAVGSIVVHRRQTATWWLMSGAVATLVLSMAHQFFYYNYALGIMALYISAYGLTLHVRKEA